MKFINSRFMNGRTFQPALKLSLKQQCLTENGSSGGIAVTAMALPTANHLHPAKGV
jgi:hypothetical protein